MKRSGTSKYAWFAAFLLLVGLSVVLAARAGNYLLVDAPQRSDVILALAGETDRRPALALELLAQGYGQKVIINVPAAAQVYGSSDVGLAQKYFQSLPQAAAISVCPIAGLSTKEESKDAEKCLQREGARSVLIVTSDYHTRRARDIFRHEIPALEFSVAAARDDSYFGTRWWQHRQWAKTFVDEWLRLIWWKVVDQWR
jgi:hypothetical protein